MILVIVGTIVIVGATVGIGLWLDKKVGFIAGPEDFETDEQRARKKRVAHAAGEAPATALRLRDAQLASLRVAQRCPSCRDVMREDGESAVRYNDTELHVLHFTCARCGSVRSLYVERI
jgi:hypothetical protein